MDAKKPKPRPKRNRKPKPKPVAAPVEGTKHTLHETEEKKHDLASGKLSIFDGIEEDQALLDKLANPNIIIKHLTIGVSAAFKNGSKNLIAAALKRRYQSIALKIQWMAKNEILNPRAIDHAVQVLEMVAAADVVDSEIYFSLKFCQLDEQGVEKISNALAKVSHLKSITLMDSTDVFGWAVLEKLADAKNNLKTFLIRKDSEVSYTREEDLANSLSKLITQKPTLEKLDLIGVFEWGSNQYWEIIFPSIINSNIRHIHAPKSVFYMYTLTNFFAQAKNLRVFEAEFSTVMYDNNNFFGLKDNTTLRVLNMKKAPVDLTLLPEIIRSNTTLQSLQFAIDIRKEPGMALYKRILEALKENKTLWCFQCDKKGALPPARNEAYQEVVKLEYDVAESSQTLRKFNELNMENLKRNAKTYATNKMAIATFVILLAKNRATLMFMLPFELWLKIAYYMNTPGLMDVEKLLLETMQRYEQTKM